MFAREEGCCVYGTKICRVVHWYVVLKTCKYIKTPVKILNFKFSSQVNFFDHFRWFKR